MKLGLKLAASPFDDLAQRRWATRMALESSARHCGAPPLAFAKDSAGAPLPEGPWHWSSSDTRGLSAAVVAPCPIGVDVEWRGRRRLEAARASAHPGELDWVGGDALWLWTAKEAYLKQLGVGLSELSLCRAVGRQGPLVELEHRGRRVQVRTFLWGEHYLACACVARDVTFELAVL